MKSWFRALLTSYADAFEGLPRDVWWLSLVLFINRCGTMVLPFWALYCKSERGFSGAQIGWLLSLYGVGSLLGALLGGWLTNRLGALRVHWISLFLSGIGFLVLLKLTSFVAIAVCFLILSIVAEMLRPASTTASANLCPPEQHPRAMALNRLALNLGMSVAPALGGFLAERSFAWLFWFDGVTCIVAGIVFLLCFGTRANVVPMDQSAPAPSSRASLWAPWLNWRFAWFAVCNFLLALVFFQLFSTYVLYLDEIYQLAKFQIGLLMAINTIMIVIIEMLLIRRVESLNILRVIGVGFLFSGVGFCILPFGVQIGMAWAAFSVVLWTIGEMLSMPMGAAFSAQQATPVERGSYMGAYSMTYAAALILAPMLGMWAYNVHPDLVWYGGFVLTGLACAGTWTLAEK